ncbi:MAG: TetR/AcrR family transcriptional regulator [Wenzhouxiangella sp.]|nr:MAG: TetR/AcrR family transcriptional regulator [Wenzhouxiangella sp.]
MTATPATCDRILDAAERLFAEEGFYATSLRQITQAAEANLAAVNYHFGSKQALILAVFRRRLDALNKARLARLDQAQEGNAAPELEDVLEALIVPALAFTHGSADDGHRFMRILMRAFADRDDQLHRALSAEYAHVMRRFASAIATALPGLSERRLRRQLDFIVGALTYTMAESTSSDAREIADDLVQFAAAGLRSAVSVRHPDGAPRTLEIHS